MSPRRFWSSAFLVAASFASVAALFFPFDALGLVTAADRQRAWLLTVWTSGVMGICFGASGLLTAITPIGIRDVADAGSVRAALEARRNARERQSETAFYNFAGWTLSTGGILLLLYFAAWFAINLQN